MGQVFCISARLTAWMVILALGASVRAMAMPASVRSRCNTASRSAPRWAGAAPVTRKETGPSKREKYGRRRPDSKVKARSRKSRAMSELAAIGALGCARAKLLIGGRALSPAGAARLTVSWGATGMQAPNITHKGKRKRRIMPAPTGGTPVPRGGGVSAGVRQNSQSSFASVLRFSGKFTASRDADMGAMRRH